MSTNRAVSGTEAPWERYGAALEALRRIEASASVDGDLIGHEDRVAFTTRALARAHGIDRPTVERMTVAARYHDIGKLKVDPAVLRKPGRFVPEERREMERHAAFGHQVLSGIDGVDPMMLDAARYHHERFDGHGYEKLSGEDIPLVARVIAVADVHDALMSKRCYKEARPETDVLSTMTADVRWPDLGRDAFDPVLLREFVAMRLADPEFNAAEDARLEDLRAAGVEAVDVRPELAEFAASEHEAAPAAPAPRG